MYKNVCKEQWLGNLSYLRAVSGKLFYGALNEIKCVRKYQKAAAG